MPTTDLSRKTATAALTALMLALLSSCTGSDEASKESSLTAAETCGGLSADAAAFLEEVTGEKEFTKSSAATTEKFARELATDLTSGTEDSAREFCHIRPEGPSAKNAPQPRISFEQTNKVPYIEDDVVGIEKFPIGLLAVGEFRGADLYFECQQQTDRVSENDGPIIHGNLAYELPGAGEEWPTKENVKILQDVSFRLAKKLGCRDNGGIPKL